MTKHQALISALQAGERVMMEFSEELEGDMAPVVRGYQTLLVRFEKVFGRPWKPGAKFEAWAQEHKAALLSKVE